MRVGLVLGAGGITGHSFHAGVLEAIEREVGWDPRTAEVIVGTSAGSGAGLLLRAGLSARDLAARAAGEPLSQEAATLLGPLVTPIDLMPRLRGRVRMASPEVFARAMLPPWRVRPGVVLAAALPPGTVDIAPMVGANRNVLPRWPARDFWVCAVSLRTGRRVVFGRTRSPFADPAEAVAASCAIPGWIRPIEIGGERYVDGGVHSPTNADVVAGLGLDLVVVSSPMSAEPGSLRGADGPARAYYRWLLRREAARVRRAGTPVVWIEPGPDDLAVMGINAMDPSRRAAVVHRVRSTMSGRLAGELGSHLTALAGARAH